ncbi:MAG: cation:proton antiporter [Rickettsiales bacterium]
MTDISNQAHGILPLLSSMILFFAIAGIVVPFLKRVGVSQILGYLICGLIIGPYGLNNLVNQYPLLAYVTISDGDLVSMIGELGIVALMFMIGLELSFARLKELRKYVFGLGSLQIVSTAVVISVICLYFGQASQTAILIGAALALSSTAIIIHLLQETHKLNQPVGKIAFSILLMQDLAVVPILVLVGAMSNIAEVNIFIILLKAIFTAFVAIMVIYFLGKTILRPILNYLSLANHPEWLTAITMFLLVSAAAITEIVGLSAALGAFLVGLLIAETEYKHEIMVIIEPIKGILLGIFFLSVGMIIDINLFIQQPIWFILAAIMLFIIKTIINFILCLIFKIPKNRAIEVSVTLAQCGEFAFLIITLALAQNLLAQPIAQFLLMVVAMSMLITPFTIKLARPIGKIINKIFSLNISEAKFEQNLSQEDRHVIIAGYGRVGKVVGDVLEKRLVPFVAIDRDIELVEENKKKGFKILYGNAKRTALLRRLNISNAAAFVITIQNIEDSLHILQELKKSYPTLPIIVRAKDTSRLEELYENGAKYVITETLESGLQIASYLLESLGMKHSEALDYIEQKRKLSLIEHSDL